jgi:hypothetical protein
MSPTTASPDWDVDQSIDQSTDESTQTPSDPWSADWDVPSRDELEVRHETVRRHQREGKIPSRRIDQVQRTDTEVDRRADVRSDRRQDAQGDRSEDAQGDRRAETQVDRRADNRVDQEWLDTYSQDREQDREDGPANSD